MRIVLDTNGEVKLDISDQGKGRFKISRVICETPGWVQPNGRLKERAARDLLGTIRGRGRDAGCPAPPAEIRTCGTTAYGSCLR